MPRRTAGLMNLSDGNISGRRRYKLHVPRKSECMLRLDALDVFTFNQMAEQAVLPRTLEIFKVSPE